MIQNSIPLLPSYANSRYDFSSPLTSADSLESLTRANQPLSAAFLLRQDLLNVAQPVNAQACTTTNKRKIPVEHRAHRAMAVVRDLIKQGRSLQDWYCCVRLGESLYAYEKQSVEMLADEASALLERCIKTANALKAAHEAGYADSRLAHKLQLLHNMALALPLTAACDIEVAKHGAQQETGRSFEPDDIYVNRMGWIIMPEFKCKNGAPLSGSDLLLAKRRYLHSVSYLAIPPGAPTPRQ